MQQGMFQNGKPGFGAIVELEGQVALKELDRRIERAVLVVGSDPISTFDQNYFAAFVFRVAAVFLSRGAEP